MKAVTALIGPLSLAGANFLLSISLQHFESAHLFGLYAFAQVTIATGLGVSNGLFGTPVVVAMAPEALDKTAVLGGFFRANLLFCLVGTVVLFVVMQAAAGDLGQSVLAAALGATMWLRWFFRSLELGLHRRRPAVVTDLIYGGACLTGLMALMLLGAISTSSILILQTLACLVSAAALYHSIAVSALASARVGLASFWISFASHGRWAVTATTATEITSNTHAYVVTFLMGPAAFAPIALATLLFRPLGVVLTGLVLFERPRMAGAIARRAASELAGYVRFVTVVVGATWALNLVAVLSVLGLAPQLVVRDGYTHGGLSSAMGLMALIVLARGMREPKTAALQAAGELRPLAWMAILSAPVTLVAILVVMAVFPGQAPLALIGALLGEIVHLVLVRRRHGAFDRDLRASMGGSPA